MLGGRSPRCLNCRHGRGAVPVESGSGRQSANLPPHSQYSEQARRWNPRSNEMPRPRRRSTCFFYTRSIVDLCAQVSVTPMQRVQSLSRLSTIVVRSSAASLVTSTFSSHSAHILGPFFEAYQNLPGRCLVCKHGSHVINIPKAD